MRIEQHRIDGYRNRFINRADTFAQQLADGSYIRQQKPVTDTVIHHHLEGRITAGWYALGTDSTAKWGVLDADDNDGLAKLSHVWLQLDTLGIPSHLESSRRGGHLWLLMRDSVPGQAVRDLLQIAAVHLDELELYPKQDYLDARRPVGSLVRGPLGFHLKAFPPQRYPFLDPISLRPLSKSVGATLDYLIAEAETVSIEQAATAVVASHKAPSPTHDIGTKREPRPNMAEQGSPLEQAKQQLGDPVTFISQYTQLSPSGKGLCPFHKDTRPSFAVDPKTGRWTDFHEFHPDTKHYTSGDTLDFYARQNGLTIKEAIRQILQQH